MSGDCPEVRRATRVSLLDAWAHRSFAALRMTERGGVILSAAKDLSPTSGQSPADMYDTVLQSMLYS